MKIRGLHVEGFGHFADRQIGPFDRPVTIFHGLNEAGKSTLLDFIKRVLYGFRTGRGRLPADYNDYRLLAGGRHGGSVTIVSDGGEVFTVRRVTGKGAGSVTLTTAAGEMIPEADLPRLLGNHPKDVFESVFAFTLDELHNGALLADSSVNSQIYSAGMGALKLPSALKTLNDQKAKLFLKGGSKHAIHDAAGRLEEITSKLKEVESNAVEYGRQSARLKEIKREIDSLHEHRRKVDSKLQGHRTIEKASNDWNDLTSAERRLEELPVVDKFPADGINRLEALEERVRTARREHESAGVRVREAERGVQVRVEHEDIIKHSADIRRLQNGRTAFDGSVKDLPEREIELEGHRRTLAETLKGLGLDWDEARLEDFDLSISVRQEISEHRDRLRDASAERSSRRSTLSQNKVALEEAINAESKALRELDSSAVPGLDADQIRQRRNLIRTARSQLAEIGRHQQNVLNLQSQLDGLESTVLPVGGTDRSRTVAAGSFVIGTALLIAGAVLGGTALFIGIAAGIALGGVALYLFMSGKLGLSIAEESPLAGPIRESLRRTKADMKAIQSKLTRDLAPLGLEEIDESSLLSAEESIDEEESRLRERTRLSEALDAVEDLTKQRQNHVEESAVAVKDAERQLDAAQRGWQEWLRIRGLLDTFTPETAEVLQGHVELGRGRLGDVRSWQQRIKAIEKDIEEYLEAVEPLTLAFDVTFDRNDWRTVAAGADRLVELLEKVQESVRNRTDAEAELDDAERQLQERRGGLRKAEEELNQLLRSGDAEEAEEFRVRADLSERRTGLEEKARTSLDRLQRLSGPGKALETLRSRLAASNAQTIGDDISRSKADLDEIDKKIEELATERGSVRRKLDEMLGEEDSSKLRTERHMLLEQIRGHAREWVVRTIAENLLKEAQARFEKERQPDVVRHAAAFFKDITGERYGTVFSPVGRPEIHVTDSAGISKQPQQLSRGTREQLFLSLRFGLVRDMGQRSERLPVIVDEALVNFDPDRGLKAAGAFVDLAQTNQVLVFTCHPQIVHWFVSAASERGAQPPQVIKFGEAVSQVS